jgi:hypothetical protein
MEAGFRRRYAAPAADSVGTAPQTGPVQAAPQAGSPQVPQMIPGVAYQPQPGQYLVPAPPNPAFVPPAAAWPTAANPYQPPQAAGGIVGNPQALAQMTNEHAVRNGTYAQARQGIMASLMSAQQGGNVIPFPNPQQRTQGYQVPGAMAQGPVQHAPMPGGAFVPQGNPTGPYSRNPTQGYAPALPPQWAGGQYPGAQAPAGYVQGPPQGHPQQQQWAPQGVPQQPQMPYNPYMAPQQVGPMMPGVPQQQSQSQFFNPAQGVGNDFAAAQAAIARTNAGQNPLANHPQSAAGVAGAMQQQAAWARANGMDPQALMAQRFAESPPEAAGQ